MIGLGLALSLGAGGRAQFGPELLTNASFASATGWTAETGWTIAGAQAALSQAYNTGFTNLYQQPSLVSGATYRVTVVVVAAPVAGRVAVRFGASTYGADITTTGTLTFDFTAGTTGAVLVGLQHISGGSAGTTAITVSTVSCKQKYF